jgi:hypothetical protein
VFALSRALIRALEQDRNEERDVLPDWDTQMMPLAREIVLNGSSRYLRVPEAFGHPEHKWMQEFARDIQDFKLRQRLLQALRGRGACQRFKTLLKESPDDGKRWIDYHVSRWELLIQGWLESQGILAVNARPQLRAAS